MQTSNITPFRNDGLERAVVFVHGYKGAQNDTWDRFPLILNNPQHDFDIYTIGYATTLLPDVIGIWSSDPDLPILAMMLCTELAISPFDRYRSLSLIAHSMGGLVVQKALVDEPKLAARTENVILFGTPSAGLRKAGIFQFWKRQLKNMAWQSEFIRSLRADWQKLFGPKCPFNFLAVAGASDQFVGPDSSIEPFDRPMRRVVPGDHVSIVKPADPAAPSVALVLATLSTGRVPAPDPIAQIRLAAEQPTDNAPALVNALGRSADVAWQDIVDAALALDRAGMRAESVALLDRHKDKHTDIKGSLGGRYKRMWFDTGDPQYAERASKLYVEALTLALANHDSGQISYLAINVAFMKFTFHEDPPGAQAMAALAALHATPAGDDVWKTATVAESHLYFGRTEQALAEYKRLLTLKADDWKYKSAALQASRLAVKLENQQLVEELDALFTPASRQANRIFVSYSHADRAWVERLQSQIDPYLRDASAELDLWDDTRLQPGQQWDVELRRALDRAGVVIALVSDAYLSSKQVIDYELPAILDAAKDGELQLLTVYVAPTASPVKPLSDFQAAHDPGKPLSLLSADEQDEVLQSIAKKMKAAALQATERFKKQ